MPYKYTLFEGSRSPVTLSPENTNIKNSFEVHFDVIPYTIHAIRTEAYLSLRDNDLAVFHRSERSMVTEWRAHNFLYWLHIARERTRDVDLERNVGRWRMRAYRILEGLAYLLQR